MPAFDRSASGRSNRALFYSVDRVVYVEGGRDDKGAMESFDGHFWRKMFSSFRPDLKIQVLPRGGKANLQELAANLPNDVVDTVIIAMDRDYDELLGKLIDKPSVIYTRGYSFESDVFYDKALAELFFDLCPICDDLVEVDTHVVGLVSEFCSDVWWGQYADVCGVMVARKVIDRRKIPKYIDGGPYGTRPRISRQALARDVYAANTGSPRPQVRHVSFRRDHLPHLAVGHLYGNFCYRIMVYLHHLYSHTSKLTKDSVLAMAIANMAHYVLAKPDDELSMHYAAQFGRL